MELYIWICLTLWFAFSGVFLIGLYVVGPVIRKIMERRAELQRKDEEYDRYLQSLRAADYWMESGFTRR